jgi:hypothetical protein
MELSEGLCVARLWEFKQPADKDIPPSISA